MKNEYHVILSHRQLISQRISGAIALDVRDFFLHSATREQTTIYGGQQENVFPDINYCGIKPSRFRLCKRATDYGRQLAAIIPNHAGSFVEVHNRAPVFNLLCERLPKAHVCLYLHNDPEIIKGLKSLPERRAVLSKAAAVICVSEFVRRQFLAGIDNQHEKVHVVYLGIDVKDRAPPAEDASPRIVFAGRLIREKGALQLARALGQVLPRHPEWSAVFIGGKRHAKSGARTKFEQQVFEAVAPVQDQVDFTGHISNDEVQDRFFHSRIAVVPSICTEAFGRVAMEAMVNGCAIISSGRGGLKEVTDGVELTVNPEDETSIAHALQKLVSDPALLNNLRLRSFESVCNRLDIRRLSRQLDELREKIMSDDN